MKQCLLMFSLFIPARDLHPNPPQNNTELPVEFLLSDKTPITLDPHETEALTNRPFNELINDPEIRPIDELPYLFAVVTTHRSPTDTTPVHHVFDAGMLSKMHNQQQNPINRQPIIQVDYFMHQPDTQEPLRPVCSRDQTGSYRPKYMKLFLSNVNDAQNNDADAQHKLGCLYALDTENHACQQIAFKLFARAVNQHHTNAHFCLGFMRHHGLGFAQDLQAAFYHYRYAALNGHTQAGEHMNQLIGASSYLPPHNY